MLRKRMDEWFLLKKAVEKKVPKSKENLFILIEKDRRINRNLGDKKPLGSMG